MLYLQSVTVVFIIICCLFEDVMEDLYKYVNPLNKRHSPMIAKETLDIVIENKAVSDDSFHVSKVPTTSSKERVIAIMSFFLQRLNSAIIYDRDFSYNFFGFKVK